MPTTTAQPLAPVRRSPHAHRLVSVEISDSPGALARVLTLLLRRRCVVTSVDFVAADHHRPGRLVLGYEAPAAHADRSVDWLRALVDVVVVEPFGHHAVQPPSIRSTVPATEPEASQAR